VRGYLRSPLANPTDAGRRECPPSVPRSYTPHHTGLGYEVLTLESEACFVPDDMFRLLDKLVDEAVQKTKDSGAHLPVGTREDARLVSTAIGKVLASHSFGLYIPTETLGDALVLRNKPNEPERHIFDCDTGSFIYLTVGDVLKLPTSLVEITLPSDAGHNYIRWQLTADMTLDWDTNGRTECATPPNQPSFQGKSMTHDQVIGYAYAIRAAVRNVHQDYPKALLDFRKSIELYPESPLASNNLAWMIATKVFDGRDQLKDEGVREATRAVSVLRTANQLDTLACAFAFRGDFAAATRTETEAIALNPNDAFSERLRRFAIPQDCTGIE